MGERKQQFDALFKILIAVAFAFLYAAGGSEDFGGMKWLRRYLAPTLLCGGMFYFSRDWKSLLQLPLMFASLSIGYGADIEFVKILKRSLFGLANGISSSGKNIADAILNNKKKWILVGFQAALLIAAYISFGVWNPFPNARVEEMVLGFLIAFIPIMSA